jgi:SulP family sulfate permease
MAFGIASGVAPAAGIFTAIIAGFIISALGGSRVQIGGPTGAFVVIVYGIIQKYGFADLLLCTLMAGVILVILGVTRLGGMIKYIPYPVTMGFTNGIAILIFSTQIKDFLGLKLDAVPADFFEKLHALGSHLGTVNPTTFALAAISLGLIVAWPQKWARRVPGSIVAVVLGTLAAAWFGLDVETIGSKFGGIPQSLPPFAIPEITWAKVRVLISPATTIALLAAIESLLSAVVADGMIDDKHDSNQELIAQGLANLASPLWGGIPATGAIARTATNVKNGARTPIAGMVHALVLLIIVLVAAPLAQFIPLATLSAVLVFVAWNMGEWHEFRRLKEYPKSDAAVLLTTFGLTVIFDLTVAVEVGMILAAMLFIHRMSETTQIERVVEGVEDEAGETAREIPQGVMVYRVFGVLFFGAADKFETALQRAALNPEVLILRMRTVVAMDATALNALESLYEKLKARGKEMILSGPHTQPYMLMENSGFLERIGQDNVLGSLDESLERAKVLLDQRKKR